MVRVTFIALVLLYAGSTPAYGQLFNFPQTRDRGEPIFTPLKDLRERAENGLIAEKQKEICASCKLNGKLFPQAACKRCQREKKKEQEKEDAAKAEAAELQKLEAEAKKAELEAKLLEEQDLERNKPWDVADEENLEMGDLLELAAQAKKDQDLAPKKQQALDYLASLGCNKDPRVTKAIMAGLQDYNEEVRLTAVQAVIYAVRGPAGFEYPVDPFAANPYVMYGDPMAVSAGCGCATSARFSTRRCDRLCKSCSPQAPPEDKDCPVCDVAKKKKEAKQARKDQREARRTACRCGRINGRCNCGLPTNDGCGCSDVAWGVPCDTDMPCETCSTCGDGCKSCCDEKIREELRKMAFDPDPKRPNCFYEPSLEVRNLALEALNLCPEVAKEKDPDRKPRQGNSEGEGQSEQGSGISEGESDQFEEPEVDEDMALPGPDDEDEATDAEETSESFLLNGKVQPNRVQQAAAKMLRGRVIKFLAGGYEIQHSQQYQLPQGSLLYINTGGNDAHVAQVINSNAGSATVKIVDGRYAARTSNVQIGVMR